MRQIVVVHPTRGRYPQSLETVSKWLNSADNHVQYLLSVDKSDAIYYENVYPCKVVRNDNKTAIEAINNAVFNFTRAAYYASPDCIFVVVSDDFDCPKHWDTMLREAIGDKINFCAKTDDGLQKTLITLPIIDREFYDDRGYVYYPGYKHLFADQEMTAVALMTGKFIQLDIKFEHLHYSTRKTPKDEINVRNDLTWKQGENLFNERLKINFGIANPIIQYSEIQWR